MFEFKEINGKLCRIVEQPCPRCGQSEIIAEPVKEGSREWALYQMQRGLAVSIFDKPNRFIRLIGDRIQDSGNHGFWNGKTCVNFMSYAAKTGWQLYEPNTASKKGNPIMCEEDIAELNEPKPPKKPNYITCSKCGGTGHEIATEPKPLLADAKVGDLCQRSNGRYTQFHSKHKLNDGSIAYYFTDASGSTDIDGNHCIYECGNNIVSCEPLAPEGTAEWAWQMLMLNIKVWHPAEQSMETTALPKDRFIACHAKSGWQLYEPETKPCPVCNGTGFVSYDDMDGITTQSCSCHRISEQPKQPFANVKKGDFVKHLDGRQLRIVEIKEPDCLTSPHAKDRNKKFKCDNGNAYSVVDGSCVRNDDTITRILKPEEVKVKITLEGTVEKRKDNRFAFNLVSGITNSAIHYDMLDPATAALVRDLIAKQGEK